ncbi:hypothetical protein AUK40_06115 [Candidatus Wirthbacteria bacterium CG2_30_54_11]|uniref:R3H domain-containing protein n=1 Tax=Candidatus Wirthbacteria bacterium CG2_30_54_11 TaxID=1817892 RepID=A0A1J5IQ59_9BACT|nr:MAG: hypothetical protein AUK40_06115 [Candidatus Wirthbacteria bacterium CG2_30_54_11]
MTISITTVNSCREIVEELLAKMDIASEITLRANEEFLYVDIATEHSGLLIGHHGDTLMSLQTVVGLMLSRRVGERIHVVVDVEHYRERREEALTNMAKRAAEEVMLSQKPITLEPMQPFERRIVHLVLQGYPGIMTESEGVEPDRRVMIKPAV